MYKPKKLEWFPDRIKSIGSRAFEGNPYFKGSLTFSKLEELGDRAFRNSSIAGINLTKCVNLKKIGAGAFCGSDLSSIALPPNLEELGDTVFANCTKLTNAPSYNMLMPHSLKKVGSGAFMNCSGIRYFDAGNCEDLSYLGIASPTTLSYNVHGCFEGCTSLERAIFGGLIKEIKSSTFKNCASLKRVKLPDCVATIGREAFFNCVSLYGMQGKGNLTLPLSIAEIGYNAFDGCSSIKLIRYPLEKNHIIRVNDKSFANNFNLKYIIPILIENDEDRQNISSRQSAQISFVSKPTRSGLDFWIDSFFNCPNFKSYPLFVDGDDLERTGLVFETLFVPSFVTDVNPQQVDILYPIQDDFYPIQNNVMNNIKEIYFANGINRIAADSFSKYKNISNVVFNSKDAEEDEEDELDENDTSFEEVSLSIEAGAFANNLAMRVVECAYITPPALNDAAFPQSVYDTAELIVPDASLRLYASAPGWRLFRTIKSTDGNSSIDDVEIDRNPGSVHYYNMHGLEVTHPEHGVYIMKQGNVTRKVVL